MHNFTEHRMLNSDGQHSPLNNGVAIVQNLVTLQHFDNVLATGGNNIVEASESLTSFWTMDTPLFSEHLKHRHI